MDLAARVCQVDSVGKVVNRADSIDKAVKAELTDKTAATAKVDKVARTSKVDKL